MAVSVVQTNGATTAGATSIVPTFGGNATLSNIVFAVVSSISNTVTSITGVGTTWDFLYWLQNPTTLGYLYVYQTTVTSASAAITINFSGSTAASATILEVSGASIEIDTYDTMYQNTSATANLYTWATTVNGDLILAFNTWNSNTTVSTNPSGYTMATAQISTGCGLSVGYQVQATAGTLASTTWVTAASATNLCAAIAIKSSATAGGNLSQLLGVAYCAPAAPGPTTAVAVLTPNQYDTMIMKVATQANPAFTVSDTFGNSWVQDINVNQSSAAVQVFHTSNNAPSGTALNITCNYSGSIPITMIVEDWANVGAVNVSNSNTSASSASITTGSVTTTVNKTLIVACVACSSPQSITTVPSNSFGSMGGSENAVTSREEQIGGTISETSTGTYSTGWTLGSATQWTAVIIAYSAVQQPAPSGTTLVVAYNYIEDWTMDY